MRQHKKTERKSNFEKCFRILEYLRRYSDKEHRLDQSDLRKVSGLSECIGDKGAFNDNINAMAETLNYDEFGIKEEKDWRLIFDAFTRENGDDYLEDDAELPWQIENENGVLPRRPVKNIYYNHLFSYEDIDAIEEGILFSKTIGTERAEKLIARIEDNLTSIYYKKGAKNICTVFEPNLMDRERLRKNLTLLSEAINKHIQVTMVLCSYSLKKKLEPSGAGRQYLSPYYLVAYGGRYYLLCTYETPGKKDANHQMYILRADLMKDMELPEYDPLDDTKAGIPATPKEKVKNLPGEWNDSFQISHLNMTYGEPIWITLRINRFEPGEDIQNAKELPFTFLHDWFGDTYRYAGRDRKDERYEIVKVKCPAFAMENWALQYGDRVEVLEPVQVREGIKRKIEALKRKYF